MKSLAIEALTNSEKHMVNYREKSNNPKREKPPQLANVPKRSKRDHSDIFNALSTGIDNIRMS